MPARPSSGKPSRRPRQVRNTALFTRRDKRLPLNAPHPSWYLNEKMMVAVPIVKSSAAYADNLSSRGKPRFTKRLHTSSSTKWRIVYAVRRGPTEFVVLDKSVARYDKPNPGREFLEALATEFGAPKAPSRIPKMEPWELTGL